MDCGVCLTPKKNYFVLCTNSHRICIDCQQLLLNFNENAKCPFCRESLELQQPQHLRRIYCQTDDTSRQITVILQDKQMQTTTGPLAVKMFACNQHIKYLQKQKIWEQYDKFISQVIQRDINEKQYSQFTTLDDFLQNNNLCFFPLPIDSYKGIIYKFTRIANQWCLFIKVIQLDLCDNYCFSDIQFGARELNQ